MKGTPVNGAVAAVALGVVLSAGVAQARGESRPTARAPAADSRAGAANPAAARQRLQSRAAGVTGLAGAVQRADGAWMVHATLGGHGDIADPGTRVIQGKVAPGSSPGCVTDQGNVVFEAGAQLEIELGGTTACTGYDRYAVALSLSLRGPTMNVVLINGFVPAAGQRFDVLDWGTLTGTFGTVNLPALPHGLTWDTTALHTSGEIAVVAPVADSDVPLPAWAIVLLGSGLAMGLKRASGRKAGGQVRVSRASCTRE
jgi:hypothetical protein